MMQQQVDDVCVSLLCSLMQRCVTVLQGRDKVSENTGNQTHPQRQTSSDVQPKRYENMGSYLRLSVDLCLVFQQEVHHLHVAIVTGHMKWSVSKLTAQKGKVCQHLCAHSKTLMEA